MQYKKWGVLSLVILASFTWLNWSAISAIEVSDSRAQSAERNPKQLAQSSQQVSWGSVLQNFLKRRPPTTKRPGGGRGEVCAIAPGVWSTTIWNTRPLLVWDGNIRVVGVRLADAENIPPKSIASVEKNSINRLTYKGNSLESGKTYEWLFFLNQNSTSPLLWIPFRVMDEKERTKIAKELAILDNKLNAKRTSQEARALQRANFFAQRQLLSDALQEIYSVKTPSVKLQQVIKEIEKEICQPEAMNKNL